MDREKVIKGLEFTKAMMTFNPSTGEDIEPENLNEANKTTYDACVGALALLKEQEAMNVDAFVQWCIDSHIMGNATVRGIKYWVEKYKEYKEIKEGGLDMKEWIPKDNLPSSVTFICPHCNGQVTYHHGSSSKSRKNSGLTKRCLYEYCPWCQEKVEPYQAKIPAEQKMEDERNEGVSEN